MKHSGGGWIIIHSVSYVLLSAILWGSPFFISLADSVQPSDLVISRVQITGGTGKTDNDFISIYNKSNEIIDLSGLRLVKRTKTGTTDTTIKSWIEPYFLNPSEIYTWANSNNSFADSINANTSSTQTISADNGIAIRQGAENSGTVIDSVAWGSSQNIYIETSPFSQNPGANEILERIDNQDTNNNSLDFRILTNIVSPVCGNLIIESPETCDDGNQISGDGCDALCHLESSPSVCGNTILENGEQCDDGNIVSGDGCSALCQQEIAPEPIAIYINEFVSDPISGVNEWIELYSPSQSAFSFTDWTVEDGAGSKTKISGSIGGNIKFYIIEKPTGSLNNAGDIIILRNKIGLIINQVTYGDWNDGNTSDNAPVTEDPFSIALKTDGLVTGNNNYDYAITSTPTKGISNIITSPANVEENESNQYDYNKNITISEIFPNPVGIDSLSQQKEFIEIYNNSELSVNLTGWHLEFDDGVYTYEFPVNLQLGSKKYLLIQSNYFKLNNDSGKIKLFQPTKLTALQTISYKDGLENQSWNLINETNITNKLWKWTSLPTPGSVNKQALPPQSFFDYSLPLIEGTQIQFDSSDSFIDSTPVSFTWNFGDNSMSLLPHPTHTYTTAGTFTVVLTIKNQYGSSTISKKLKINQKNRDDSLEIASIESNSDETTQFLHQLRFNEVFPNPPGKDDGQEWVEIFNAGTDNVNLKNWRISNKSKKGPLININLNIEPQNLTIISATYLPILGNSQETLSLLDPTGEIIDTISYDNAPENQSYNLIHSQWQWTSLITPSRENASNQNVRNNQSIKTNPPDPKQKIITGAVVTLPGTFSTQYFLIKLNESEALYQIYSSKKLFPDLKLGQEITATGELSEIANGQRLKIQTINDIQIIGEINLPKPKLETSVDIKIPPYPRLVQVEGEITSKKSPRLILTDTNGDIEIYLAKGSNLSITRFALGDTLNIIGIAEISGTSLRVMPRSEKDITFLNAESGPESTISSQEINNKLSTSKRDNKKNLFTYLIISGLGLLIAVGFGFWKYWQKKK